MRALEKHVMLSVLDNDWKEHLASMDYLRQGIYLRGYAQKQPKQEFKREAFELFELDAREVKHEIIQLLARVRIRSEDEVAGSRRAAAAPGAGAPACSSSTPTPAACGAGERSGAEARRRRCRRRPCSRDAPKVGRNDPCPCGSGKKYKHCHGQLA